MLSVVQSVHEHVLPERRKHDCRPNNATDSFYDLEKVLSSLKALLIFLRTKQKSWITLSLALLVPGLQTRWSEGRLTRWLTSLFLTTSLAKGSSRKKSWSCLFNIISTPRSIFHWKENWKALKIYMTQIIGDFKICVYWDKIHII